MTCQARWRITVWNTMNLSAFQRLCQTPVSYAASAWTKRCPTLPLGMSYRLTGITARFLQQDCHAWSFLTPPLRCAPSLDCTQSPYTSLIHRSSPAGTYPRRSPAGPSPSSILSVLSPVIFVVVITSACCSDLNVSSGDGGAALHAAAARTSRRAAFRLPPSPPSKFRSCASERGDGTLAHPQHRKSEQWNTILQQAHRWVLQYDMCLH